nr:PREDICTED: transcription initiation factor TFIID subunit 4-like [Struthio camelus australis]
MHPGDPGAQPAPARGQAPPHPLNSCSLTPAHLILLAGNELPPRQTAVAGGLSVAPGQGDAPSPELCGGRSHLRGSPSPTGVSGRGLTDQGRCKKCLQTGRHGSRAELAPTPCARGTREEEEEEEGWLMHSSQPGKAAPVLRQPPAALAHPRFPAALTAPLGSWRARSHEGAPPPPPWPCAGPAGARPCPAAPAPQGAGTPGQLCPGRGGLGHPITQPAPAVVPGEWPGWRPQAFHSRFVSPLPVDRSLQNLSLAQSLSLNLKNHYSLDINLPSTSTPASILGSPVAPGSLSALASGDSYLNLLNLERGGSCYDGKEGDECLAVLEGQDGVSRRVEGSAVSEFAPLNGSSRQKADDVDSRVDEDRRQQPIPKINPPPPILRKRSSKTSPSLEVDAKPETTVHVSLPSPSVSSLTNITASSLTLLDPEVRTSAWSAASSTELVPAGTSQHALGKDRTGENGHVSPLSSIHDAATGEALGRNLAALASPMDSTLPFSPVDDTCLHISFSEDELLEPELDAALGPSRVPA